MWTRLLNKLRYLVAGSRIDRDLSQELDFHRDMLAADRERLGYSPAAAALSARRRMGNTALMTEHSRDAWVVAWLDTLLRDLRYAVRAFGRQPVFTLVALATLALGIGANTAIFRLVDTVLLRALPVERPDELVAIRHNFSYWQFDEVRRRTDVLTESLGAATLLDVELAAGAQPIGRGAIELVTGNYFSLLGVRPALGRPLAPGDDRSAGAGAVAVISHGLWQRAFGGAPDVLGRTIRLHGGRFGGVGTSGFEPPAPEAPPPRDAVLTIVGVAPAEFFGDSVGTLVEVWTPITMQPIVTPGRAWLTRKTAYWVNIMGRRRPGLSDDEVRASLTTTWRQIRADEIGPSISPEDQRALAAAQLVVEPGARGFSDLRQSFSQPLLILMAIVTLVLLIACLNVANLLLARATARQQEISMRLSLGASRRRIVRQLLTESLLLAGAGGALGLLLATFGADLLVAMVSGDQHTITLQLSPDRRVLVFTTLVSLASGIVFGLAPALGGTRQDLHHALKTAGRGAAGGRSRAAKSLVAIQVAVSLVLLVGCGLFLRTLANLRAESVGYNRDRLLLARLDPVGAGYRGEEIGRAAVDLMHRLAAIPGVASATFSENGLFSGSESGTRIAIEGFEPATADDRVARFDQAGPGYFAGVGIPIVIGRDFTERDTAGAPPVAIVNETMARFYFHGQNPIGRFIRLVNGRSAPLEIIGVARDAQDHDLRDEPLRRFYVPYLRPIDGITTLNLEIRAAADAQALFPAVRAEVQRFDPKLHILSLKTAQALVDDSIAAERMIAKLSTVFGVLAVVLAGIGLYGVMSYAVARRTSEIGVRMALGARQRSVAAMILGEILVLVVAGSAAGTLVAIALARLVEGLVFGLTPYDPLTIAAAIALLLAVAVVAGYFPARRAARIDPLVALRTE